VTDCASVFAFNPLAPNLGGSKKGGDLRDTLKLPAASRCTVLAPVTLKKTAVFANGLRVS